MQISTWKTHRSLRLRASACRCAIQLMMLLLVVFEVSSFPFVQTSSISKIRPAKPGHSHSMAVEDIVDSIETIESTSEAIELGRSQLAKDFAFPLDDWQLQAGGEILLGHNVIVCAPTGSGKTVCGEMALRSAFERGMDGIYTTPLKALSNQKFAELRQTFGAAHVGLSTGDVSINRKDARLTVMTTEVYRNIAWRSSNAPTQGGGTDEADGAQLNDKPLEQKRSNDLRQNAVVVLDEFHYMGVPGRGGVWEECVITSPAHTQIVGLSATLSNALQLAEWMEGVTGRKTVLVEAPSLRPVPLKYVFATREGLYPLFRNPDAGPGSPLGLLGYRGDGKPVSDKARKKIKKKKKITGSNDHDDDDDFEIDKLPKGLNVNPALATLAQRRMQRVNKSFERQRSRQQDDHGDNEWDLYSGRGRRTKSMSSREERKEKERILRREMRKAVPSLPVLLTRLQEQQLLPAIFFIFSRAGCDQAADSIRTACRGPRDPTVNVQFEDGFDGDSQRKPSKKNKASRQRGEKKNAPDGIFTDKNGRSFRPASNNVDEDIFNSILDSRQAALDDEVKFVSGSPLSPENWYFYSVAGLLDYDQVQGVAKRVAQFNENNPEIAFPNKVVEQYLFGVGSHHAGMLPAHKAFVEVLFRGNMMKACFATETLAAGINMPARTTVICSMAKRDGSGSMNLLETSNLQQMAGRAGRRGMDTAGTCVIVATPFESHDVAATILTNPIKPITSQFRPSYALAVNLIARGEGKLDVAKQLVSKSFAMWERRRVENEVSGASEQDDVSDVLIAISEEKFMTLLVDIFVGQINRRSAKFDTAFLSHLVDVLNDKETLKRISKGFEAAALSVELEKTTLGLLEVEMKNEYPTSTEMEGMDKELFELQTEDKESFMQQIEEQRERVVDAEKKLRKNTFTSIADYANQVIDNQSEDGLKLKSALQKTRARGDEGSAITAENLADFAKSSVVVKRKLRKLAISNPDVDPEILLLRSEKLQEIEDTSWDDMLAITKVLIAYGCIIPERKYKADDDFKDLEDQVLEVTPAGTDVGMLSFDNSLWCFSAMGGTFDVIGASSKFDDLRDAMQAFGDDSAILNEDEKDPSLSPEALPYRPQEEADELVSHLRYLSPGEIAGYVSCLVTGDTGRNSLSSMDVFQRISTRQQRAIKVLLEVTERLMDVQRQNSVDERTCLCQFDVTNCEVVSAWANGCTWSEALEMSGAAPGDLTRILGRAMDAVRQLGSLKYNPLRKEDFDSKAVANPFARGIHPDIRALCRDAGRAMNRYPVKDPLPFEADEEDIFDDVADTEDVSAVVDAEVDGSTENSDDQNQDALPIVV